MDESLQVRLSEEANEADAVVGLHYRLPKHSGYEDGAFLKQLREGSVSQILVATGDLDLPDGC